MNGYYVEEGDLTISSQKLVCPHCGWTLQGVYDPHEEDSLDKPDREEGPEQDPS